MVPRPLDSTVSGYVPPVGPWDAKIALVGEAPGEIEVRERAPWSGPAGKFLRSMCSAAGFSDRDCWKTNVALIRPPDNDFGIWYENKAQTRPRSELIAAYESLESELCKMPYLTTAVALGKQALRALTGKMSNDDLRLWRGSVIQHPRIARLRVVPTWHPSGLLQAPVSKRPTTQRQNVVEGDLRRALSVASGLWKPHEEDFMVLPTEGTVEYALACIRLGQLVSVDIETIGQRIHCIGIGLDVDRAISIPFMSAREINGTRSYWQPDAELRVLRMLELYIFDEPGVRLVLHNAPFDLTYIEREFGLRARHGIYLDTMLMHHCLWCELPKGLDTLASLYTRMPYWSDYDALDEEQVARYNCRDCIATLQVAEKLLENADA